jgi:hypothetical protein
LNIYMRWYEKQHVAVGLRVIERFFANETRMAKVQRTHH